MRTTCGRCSFTRSERALLEGGHPRHARVIDVALACSSSPLGHFARRFRDAFGASPREWWETRRREPAFDE